MRRGSVYSLNCQILLSLSLSRENREPAGAAMEMVMSFHASSSPLLYNPKFKVGRAFTPLSKQFDGLSSSSRTSTSIPKQALKVCSRTPLRTPVKCSASQATEARTGISLVIIRFLCSFIGVKKLVDENRRKLLVNCRPLCLLCCGLYLDIQSRKDWELGNFVSEIHI